MQRIQNIAARMITYTKSRDHITPALMDLHWLPVEQRIQYKVALYAYKALNDSAAPKYLSDLVTPYIPARSLRSSTLNQVVQQPAKTRWGDRSFSVASARIWNNLPLSIRSSKSIKSFKKNLKTHLFQSTYVSFIINLFSAGAMGVNLVYIGIMT